LPLGTILISDTGTTPKVQPKLLGKLATDAQMLMILWALFKAREIGLRTLIILSGLLTFSSGMQYIYDGVTQLNALDGKPPEPPRDSVEPAAPTIDEAQNELDRLED
jgi:hypothetical protein